MDKNAKILTVCNWVISGGLYLLAFLLPLFFLPFNANVVEMNKQLILLVFGVVLLLAWLGKMIAAGRIELRKGWLNLGVFVFLVFYLVSSILSKNVYQALVGSGGTIAESFFSLFCLALVFFVAVNNISKKEQLLNLSLALMASGFLAGLFGILQLAGKFAFSWDFAKSSAFNTVGSANSLEIFLGALLVMGVALFAGSDSSLWRKIVYGVFSAAFLAAIFVINFSNVWWALLAAMVFVVALGIINRVQANQYRLIFSMVVLAFAMLMLLIKPDLFSKFLSVPTEVSPSMNATLQIDKEAFKQAPLFGTGPGSFAYDYGLYRSQSLNDTSFWNVRFSQGFSKNAGMPATLGFFGTVAWLALVLGFAVYAVIALIRKNGANWILALSSFSAWAFLAGLQFFYGTNLSLEMAFWFLLAMSFLSLKTLGKDGESRDFASIKSVLVEFNRTSPFASILSFTLVVAIVLAISAFYIGGNYYWADILYQKGMTQVSVKGDIDNGSVTISKAVMLNPYNDLYLRTLSEAALARVNSEIAKPQSAERDANIQNLIATAINIAKRSTDLAPLNVENWAERGAIYRAVMPYLAGADQWAIDSFTEAAKLEPNNPYYYYELGVTYMVGSELKGSSKEEGAKDQQKEYLAKAEENLSKAVTLKSDYAQPRYQLAVVYDAQNQSAKAIEQMKKTQDLYPNDLGVAFQLGVLYYKENNFTAAKAQFERAISLDANYSNARYFLGLIYDRQGDKTAAIEQFQKISALNPDNAEVKTILANLQSGKPALTPAGQAAPIDNQVPQTK